MRTLMPLLVGWMSLQVLWYVRKCPVAPVLAMFVSKLILVDVEMGVNVNV